MDDIDILKKFNYTIDTSHLHFGWVTPIWRHKPLCEIVWKTILVITIMVIGLTGNFIVIFLVLKRPKIRQLPVNIFIVNLAIADFLTTLFTPVIALFNSIYQNYELGPVMCKLEILIKMMCILASIFSVVAISFHRFININNVSKTPSSGLRTLFIIVSIWIAAIVLALPLSVWREYHERHWADYLEKWCADSMSTYSKNYWIFLLTPLIYVPLIVMVVVYSAMILKINRFIMKLQKETAHYLSKRRYSTSTISSVHTMTYYPSQGPSHTPSEHSNSSIWSQNPWNLFAINKTRTGLKLARQKLSAERSKQSIMVTIFVYCIITILFWLPLQVLVYYRAIKPSSVPIPRWYERTKFIAQMLCAANSAMNPFITFRKTFLQIMRQFQTRRRHRLTQKKLKMNYLRKLHAKIEEKADKTNSHKLDCSSDNDFRPHSSKERSKSVNFISLQSRTWTNPSAGNQVIDRGSLCQSSLSIGSIGAKLFDRVEEADSNSVEEPAMSTPSDQQSDQNSTSDHGVSPVEVEQVLSALTKEVLNPSIDGAQWSPPDSSSTSAAPTTASAAVIHDGAVERGSKSSISTIGITKQVLMKYIPEIFLNENE